MVYDLIPKLSGLLSNRMSRSNGTEIAQSFTERVKKRKTKTIVNKESCDDGVPRDEMPDFCAQSLDPAGFLKLGTCSPRHWVSRGEDTIHSLHTHTVSQKDKEVCSPDLDEWSLTIRGVRRRSPAHRNVEKLMTLTLSLTPTLSPVSRDPFVPLPRKI